MKANDLFEGLEIAASSVPANLEIGGVACDSRVVKRGDLFVVVRGHREDGYKYIDQALSRGAVAIAADLPPPPSAPPWIQIGDVRRTLARLATTVNNHPSHSLNLYGITGTNGKTTVAGLLRDLLQSTGEKTGLISTVEYSYGERSISANRTTPDSCELQRLLASMVSDGCGAAVMEVSSHALDQYRTGFTRFAAVAFTNLSREHFDYHGDIDNYFETKFKLFEQLAELNPGAPAIINLDDPYGRRLLERANDLGLKHFTFGLQGAQADIIATDLELDHEGTGFTLSTPMGSRSLRSHLLGRFNVSNMLCLAGFATALEISFEKLVEMLEQARPRWGRLEKVVTPHPATIFVDYAHTADALSNVLRTLGEMKPRNLLVVFGCGGDRDKSKRPEMGRAAASLADTVIVTSDNPRSEDPEKIIADILEGMPGTGALVEPDRHAAIALALQMAGEGDIVLVAGKGHETYQETSHHRITFDDREEVRRLAADEWK